MSESAPSEALSLSEGADHGSAMASLRERGADRFDPIRFRFIEALARRAGAYRGEARRILEGKLAKALADYGEHFEQARREAGESLGRMVERFPEAADDLAHMFRAGDFRRLHRAVRELEGQCRRGPLADLVGRLAAQGGSPANDGEAHVAPVTELKSLRYFRGTWSKLSADQQLAEALAQGPENAGPLNSHRLVLQSLQRMRDISPDYLKRFLSYADALLWLDQANGAGAPMPRNAPRGEADKKRKPGRAKSG